jgi:hypothetical protein
MTDQSRLILVGMSAIANVCALVAFAAQLLRQDLWLVLAIVLVLGGFGLLLWKTHSWIGSQKLSAIIFIFLASIVFAVVSLVLLSNVKVKPVHIAVVEPKDNAQIEGYRYLIKGTVGDSNARVSVIVRPLTPLDYWVQEPPTIDASGNWQVNAHFGETTVGIGEQYEIIALATNENFIVTWVTGNSLPIGMRQDLPSSTNRSNVVTVTRVR